MRFACIVFPGTSCDIDVYNMIKEVLGEEVEYVRHTETNLDNFDCIILPGGYSYGNYLRPGAIACHSNIFAAIKKAATNGKPILGISNGFQILLEAKLLPGAMLRNKDLKFICRTEKIIVANNETMFTSEYELGQEISLPLACSDGNYYCDAETLQALEKNKQIVFQYSDNPTGSLNNIAGIINEKGNILGLMPLPERAAYELLGSTDGLQLFKSILKNWRESNVF